MKFSNGCWLNKEGVSVYSPAQVYRVTKKETGLSLLTPHSKIRHRGDTLAGPVLTVELSSPMEDVIKVKVFHYKGMIEKGPVFQVNDTGVKVMVDETDDQLTMTTGDLKVKVNKADWAMDFFNQGQRLTGTGFRNMAYVSTQDEGVFMREQLGLSVGELIYGLGERFTPFIKNGQTVDIWNEDGGTSTEQSYKNIPFYLSNKGYGVFVNHPEKVSFEVGSEKVTRVQFSVPGEALEYYIINGPTLKSIITRYTDLTGKPALPPAWTFGLWLTTSFTTNYDEATVSEFIDGMAQRDIPLHVFHFDCFWMKEFNWCDFEWDCRVFPDPENMLKRLKAKGLKICVWINPYIGQESHLFDEGKINGYLLKRPNGDVWQWDLWQPGMAIVDFTNPAACEWFKSKLRVLMDMGVDSFKTDFGERIPTDVSYFDGSDSVKMHNYYTYLYNEVVFQVLEEKYGKDQACLFARSATVGSQKFPVHWGGDCTSDYESMSESLRGGLSLCLSGFGFWSHDIGGFESTSTEDVYMRWAAFGLLSSHSRLHGSSSYRVPWLYGDKAVSVVSTFSKLKCTLMPYLFRNACETSQSGIPVMRAMVLEYQNDPMCAYLDKQYMLGDSLLVAPIFNEEGNANYYLPEGTWTNFLNNQTYQGNRYVNEVHDHLSIPLLAKENSLIPIGANDQKPDYDYKEGVTFHAFEISQGATSQIYGMDGVLTGELAVTRQDDILTFTANGIDNYQILLRNVAKVKSVIGGNAIPSPLGTMITGISSKQIVITL